MKRFSQSNDQTVKKENNGVFNFKWDIENAIIRLSRSEVLGEDLVPGSALKQEKNSPLINKLKLWFNNWICNCSIPSFLMRGKLIMISKEDSVWPKIENIRLITILHTVTKFFESSIIHNLENIILSNWK